MMRGKIGQFYLIAAVFIVLIMFGTTSVATYAVVKPEPRTVSDLSSELNRETYNIIEHGVVRDEDVNALIESFTSEDIAGYVLKNSEDASVVFVYGNNNNYNAIAVENEGIGKIRIGGSGFESGRQFNRGRKKEFDSTNDGFLRVDVKGKEYKFEIKDNEMFYFLIVKERGDEVFVDRNEEDKSKNENRPGGARRRR